MTAGFSYYTQEDEDYGLTQCQDDILSGTINISEVPVEHRDTKAYEAAYKFAAANDCKQSVDGILLSDMRSLQPGSDSYEALLGLYICHNRQVIQDNPELYFHSRQFISDLQNQAIRIYDVPFDYRDVSHYKDAFGATRQKYTGSASGDNRQEQNLLMCLLRQDILRCHAERLKEKEFYLRQLESEFSKHLLPLSTS